MQATVKKLNLSLPYCDAETSNEILVVFKPPTNGNLALGDVLDIDLTILDEEQEIKNLTKDKEFTILVKRNDIHDLRLPPSHGTSRLPSLERRAGIEN